MKGYRHNSFCMYTLLLLNKLSIISIREMQIKTFGYWELGYKLCMQSCFQAVVDRFIQLVCGQHQISITFFSLKSEKPKTVKVGSINIERSIIFITQREKHISENEYHYQQKKNLETYFSVPMWCETVRFYTTGGNS